MLKPKLSIKKIAVFGASTTFGLVDTSGKGGWVGRLKTYFERRDWGENMVFNLREQDSNSRQLSGANARQIREARSGTYLYDT